uniref:Uncharacterized protein n=1 Tax=Ascaris lumbricoides TaxID=6252 RepID=A0A0M3I850_ASCLU
MNRLVSIRWAGDEPKPSPSRYLTTSAKRSVYFGLKSA